MPINIGTKPSPHGEAAQEITEVQTKTITDGEEQVVSHEHEATPVQMAAPFEVIDVGISFRMPVAQYTMLEFTVRRSVPFNPLSQDPDAVFEATKTWVEGKLNAIIAEQQSED
jgi:hypothetical protein